MGVLFGEDAEVFELIIFLFFFQLYTAALCLAGKKNCDSEAKKQTLLAR